MYEFPVMVCTCDPTPGSAASLPLSERLSPKTIIEVYGTAAAGEPVNAKIATVQMGSNAPKDARFVKSTSPEIIYKTFFVPYDH